MTYPTQLVNPEYAQVYLLMNFQERMIVNFWRVVIRACIEMESVESSYADQGWIASYNEIFSVFILFHEEYLN